MPIMAAIDYIPLLFLIYVIFAVFSSLVKAARQAVRPSANAPVSTAPSPGTPAAQPAVTADQIRAALERRLAAAAARASAAQAQAQAAPAAIVQTIQAPQTASAPMPPLPDAGAPAIPSLGVPADMMPAPAANLASLLVSLPPAAQAMVASAVIGPCAAHRGGGHQPEDW